MKSLFIPITILSPLTTAFETNPNIKEYEYTTGSLLNAAVKITGLQLQIWHKFYNSVYCLAN